MTDEGETRELPTARHETRDVPLRAVVIGAALVALMIGFPLASNRIFFPQSLDDASLSLPPPVYPEPRLQSDPAADLQKTLTKQFARLNGAANAEEDGSHDGISIDAAMALLVAEGVPDWPGAAQPTPVPPAAPPLTAPTPPAPPPATPDAARRDAAPASSRPDTCDPRRAGAGQIACNGAKSRRAGAARPAVKRRGGPHRHAAPPR